jgi:RimJ/RimL family protein N-acetyltransferase
MWSDPDVTRFMGGPREAAWLTQNFTEDAKNTDPPLYDQWPVFEKASGELVGYCGLLDKEIDGRPEIELVYVFLPTAWGKGFGTEMAMGLREHAVQAMGLTRLVALIEPENAASVKVAERAGFHREKTVARPGGERIVYVFEV